MIYIYIWYIYDIYIYITTFFIYHYICCPQGIPMVGWVTRPSGYPLLHIKHRTKVCDQALRAAGVLNFAVDRLWEEQVVGSGREDLNKFFLGMMVEGNTYSKNCWFFPAIFGASPKVSHPQWMLAHSWAMQTLLQQLFQGHGVATDGRKLAVDFPGIFPETIPN